MNTHKCQNRVASINIGGKKKPWWHITFNFGHDEHDEHEEETDPDASVLKSFWKKFRNGVRKKFSNLKSDFTTTLA